MLFEYERWDRAKEQFEKRLRDLMRLYQRLLNMLAGDAERALQYLDRIGEKYGLWGDGLDKDAFRDLLKKSGELREDGSGRAFLTPKGEGTMRRTALRELFGDMQSRATAGEHKSRHLGAGGEIQPTVRPYAFGDDLWSISGTETLKNAVRNSIARGEELSIHEDDLAVYDTEYSTQCASALLIDCSHSMVLYGEDRMTPARTTAMALIEFIQNNYPRDRLHVIAFGDDAVEVPLKDVPYLSWGPYHTNTQAALEMARRILVRSKCPNRQIFMVTDGKPTVLDEGPRRYIDSGWLNRRIVNRTLEEAAQCRRKNIVITTFMVTDDPILVQFVEQLTEINQGRAYYTGLGKLGQSLLVDYVTNRKRSVR